MVHSSPLGRRVGLVLPALALLLSGCLGLDKVSLPSFKSAPPTPTHVEVIWSKQVQNIPDHTRGGQTTPALVGRVYLYGTDANGLPITADGKVIIDLYDDSARADGKTGVLRETMEFPPEVLQRLLARDQLGQGYSVGIPCPTDVTHTHLSLRFQPKAGGPPLVYSSSTFQLDRGMSGTLPAGIGR